MRPLRYMPPNTKWFVTSRCFQAQYLLRPDEEMNRRFGYWLGRALKRYPGIEMYAVVQMSNHFHFALNDRFGELAFFMRYFESNLAKAVNQIRNRTGTVFHRRYSAEQILDDNAFLDRVLYVVMNPVRAGLVRSYAQWPGVLLWAKEEITEYAFGWVDQAKFERHQKLRLKRPRSEYIRQSKLRLAPLEGEKALQSVITKAEDLVRESRRGLGVLGLRKLLKQDPFSRPNAPKKSPRPKCHTTCKDLKRVFAAHMRALRDAYCEVSAALRRGDVSIKFPSYTFQPFAWVPS